MNAHLSSILCNSEWVGLYLPACSHLPQLRNTRCRQVETEDYDDCKSWRQAPMTCLHTPETHSLDVPYAATSLYQRFRTMPLTVYIQKRALGNQ